MIKLAVRKIKRLTRRMAVFSWDINRQQLGLAIVRLAIIIIKALLGKKMDSCSNKKKAEASYS